MQRHRNSRSRTVRPGTWLALATVGSMAVATAIAAPLVGARSQAAPANTAKPAISGTPAAGQRLTVSNGTWSGSPTKYDYQWQRCDTAGANCGDISGGTQLAYVVSPDDVGKRLRARVIAQNGEGSGNATSDASATVTTALTTGPPVSVRPPSVSGTPAIGQQLRVATGEWGGAQPITFSFQWLRCDTGGNNCLTVSSATDDAYGVTAGDQGKTLRVRVTARNAADVETALTTPTAAVGAPAGPAGAIKLSTGETSIPASSVPATERLIVDQVTFDPTVVKSRTATFTVKVKVKDTRGNVVRDALVFLRSTPLVTKRADDRDAVTAQDGWSTVTMVPERDFPQINPAYAIQFFVKAYRQGDPELGGVSGTRLVQVPMGR